MIIADNFSVYPGLYRWLIITLFGSIALLVPTVIRADSLTLARSYELVRENAPALQQLPLLEEAYQLKIHNIRNRLLPDLGFQAKATYQSDVVSLPFNLPGAEPVELPKERAQATININQVIYDGGTNKIQRELELDQLHIDQQQVEISLHQLYQQVNSLYYAVLMARQKQEILSATEEVLLQRIKTVQVSVKNGVVLESEFLKLETELLKLRQDVNQNQEDLQAGMEMLAILLGIPAQELSSLQLTDFEVELNQNSLHNRPDMQLIDLQKKKLQTSQNQSSVQNRPRLNAFVEAGLGYPNPLNFFDNSTSPFYLAGLSLNWKIWDWNNVSREKEILGIRQNILEKERLQKIRSIETSLQQTEANIRKMQKTIEEDYHILKKQAAITRLSAVQLENGVITSTEYISQLNAEKQARLNLELHMVLLEQSKANYLLESGKIY